MRDSNACNEGATPPLVEISMASQDPMVVASLRFLEIEDIALVEHIESVLAASRVVEAREKHPGFFGSFHPELLTAEFWGCASFVRTLGHIAVLAPMAIHRKNEFRRVTGTNPPSIDRARQIAYDNT